MHGLRCSAREEDAGAGTDDLLKPNGEKLDPPRTPRMVFSPTGIVSTDTFAFDDTTDHFGLQGLGQCCDMGDATLGLAIPSWEQRAAVDRDP